MKSDFYLGAITHQGALAAGQSYSVTQDFSVPRGLLGGYYVFVLTDVPNTLRPGGYVYEGANEGNNAGKTVTLMDVDGPGVIQHIWITLDNEKELNSYTTDTIKEVILAFRQASNTTAPGSAPGFSWWRPRPTGRPAGAARRPS